MTSCHGGRDDLLDLLRREIHRQFIVPLVALFMENLYPYRYAWQNNPKRQALYGHRCRVLVRGRANSALVKFEDGSMEVVSRNALRKVKI